jgi:hypothetical protein
MMGTMMQDLAFAIPGVDEAMSFAEIMKYVTTTLCAPFPLRTYGGLTGLLQNPKLKKLKKLKKLNGQARQIHGILCNSVRHSSNWTHTAVSLFSERPRKGAGEAIDSERAYRTNDKSGMLKVFFIVFVPWGDALLALTLFHASRCLRLWVVRWTRPKTCSRSLNPCVR